MGERIRVKASRIAPEGEAIALEPGSPRVIFVPYGVPGDTLDIDVTQAKSSFARGRILQLVSPGPERVKPPCPLHFDAQAPERLACGGCDWQQFSYEAQLKHKREMVRDCLFRIGRLRDIPVADAIGSPQPWAYRNKVQIPFAPGPGPRPRAGFFAPGSHRIVDFEACPVQPDLSVRIARVVKDLVASLGLSPYEEDKDRGWLKHLYVRTNVKGEALVALVTRTSEFSKHEAFTEALRKAVPEMIGLHQNVQPHRTSVVIGDRWRHIWGARAIEEKLGRFTFVVSPGAFLQVNTPAAERLYDAALAALTEGGARFGAALDLYCGVGTLTLWVSGAVPRVLGVEENKEAVRDAYRNAKRNGVSNVRFWAGRTEAVLPRLSQEGLPERCAAVVDPPRMGLSQAALRLLTAPRFKRLVYVSCNPATFARDAANLARAGFRIRRVQPVDLFPQTSHVELVGLLDRT